VTRVAAIDCGTNSIRLLVADVTPDGLVDLDRRMEIVRLGQGVDRTGEFAADALARTFAACESYAEAIRALGAERVRFVATSASRDVRNRDAFVAGVRAAVGVDPEVVSGDEEAHLSFVGATRELRGPGSDVDASPYLVVDIGGGSTELVLGDADVRSAVSIDVGCVRMTERHLHTDPPTRDEIAAATADVDASLDRAGRVVDLAATRTLVGLAGTVTTVAAMALDLPHYDAERIHRSRLGRDAVHDVAGRLLAMTRAERAALPFMHPGRVDVIGAGALVLDRVLRRTAHLDEVVVSEHDILDGIAWSLVDA
jgi:exopolyphosphatase/guanosine-5'-triphosphate,3'-diphosphate pyrophosphatase